MCQIFCIFDVFCLFSEATLCIPFQLPYINMFGRLRFRWFYKVSIAVIVLMLLILLNDANPKAEVHLSLPILNQMMLGSEQSTLKMIGPPRESSVDVPNQAAMNTAPVAASIVIGLFFGLLFERFS
jgi:hypothetical protein